jgi:hypothetical protein
VCLALTFFFFFGFDIGFWYRNLEGLASIPDTTLHAIDWLGNGQSSRVEMPKEPEKSEEVSAIGALV